MSSKTVKALPHFLMMAVSSLLSASPVPLFLEGVMSVAVKRFLFWPTSCESAMAAGFARWVLGYLTSCRSVLLPGSKYVPTLPLPHLLA